jgi:Fe-S-cluster containining protein
MENRKPFNCWKCTACCRLCDKIDDLKQFDRGDGVCINLQDDGSCGIYETRPDICNTGIMYDRAYKKRMTWDEYLSLSESACKFLEKEMNKKVDKKE